MIKLNQLNRVAIIGSGIAGLTAAHLLHRHCQVSLFEKNDYIGGHANTIKVQAASGDYAIDSGFIVMNKQNYPNFYQLMCKLGVVLQKSNMSFSFSSRKLDLEYSTDNLKGLFAQKSNLFKPKFFRLLADIGRFNRAAKRFLVNPLSNTPLSEFMVNQALKPWFNDAYLIPMAAAIWSTAPNAISKVPAEFILQFYKNHGLLELFNHPTWYVIKGGSAQYIKRLTRPFAERIFLNSEVKAVIREPDSVRILTSHGEQRFDAVVFACHSDQALTLLAKPSEKEQAILSAIPYQANRVVLHTDENALPKRRAAWASWNYIDNRTDHPSLTYYMNKLQSISAKENFCVSVNMPTIEPSKIIQAFVYSHPIYNTAGIKAKQQHALINQQQRSFYVGAYWGYGFHEDGVVSSLKAFANLGLAL